MVTKNIPSEEGGTKGCVEMDPNLIIGAGIDVYNSLPSSTQEALLNPAAKTLGEALDGAVTIICSPLLILGTLSKALLHKFSTEVNQKINGIPQSNRDTSKLGLVIKAMEEARYQLTEDDVRRMYVNLIASTVDNRKNHEVSPRLATVVSQFGPNEANFLKVVYQQSNHQVPFGYLTATKLDNISTKEISKYLFSIDNGTYLANQEASMDILRSLGIIDVYTDAWLSSDYYKSRYQTIEEVLKQNTNYSANKDEKLKLNKCYLKFNSFGESLGHCIFE